MAEVTCPGVWDAQGGSESAPLVWESLWLRGRGEERVRRGGPGTAAHKGRPALHSPGGSSGTAFREAAAHGPILNASQIPYQGARQSPPLGVTEVEGAQQGPEMRCWPGSLWQRPLGHTGCSLGTGSLRHVARAGLLARRVGVVGAHQGDSWALAFHQLTCRLRPHGRGPGSGDSGATRWHGPGLLMPVDGLIPGLRGAFPGNPEGLR